MDVEQAVGVVELGTRQTLAWGEWLRELRRYVHRLTGDPDLSEDIAQDAVIRLVQAMRNAPVEQPRPWLYRTATNLVRDHARHEAMKLRRQPPVETTAAPTPEQDLDRSEAIRAVRAALARIAPRDRELLVLRESGFRHREIAEIIGVKTESVSVLAARALERFRAAYGGSV